MLWRIHRALVKDRLDDICQVIAAFGDTIQLIDNLAILCAPPPEDLNEPAIALTTLQDAKMLHSSWTATPGVYYHPNHFAVSAWLPELTGIPILNSPWFVPAGLIAMNGMFTPQHLAGTSGRLFIRPDSGNKPFAGQTLAIGADDSWEDVARTIRTTIGTLSPTTMVCLSPAVELEPVEWRFWVVDGEIVACSGYSWEGDVSSESPPEHVTAVALAVSRHPFQIDRAYVADVVCSNGQAWLCELNAASTSGLYQCNVQALLSALRKAALDEWEDNN